MKRSSWMVSVLLLQLLLSPLCSAVDSNFTIHLTDASFPISPAISPDEACASEYAGSEIVRALVMLSNRRNILAMFPNESAFYNTAGNLMTRNFLQLSMGAFLLDSSNRTVSNATYFWTGAQHSAGDWSESNCGDFADDTIGSGLGLGNISHGLAATTGSCSDSHPYLCVRGTYYAPTPQSNASNISTDNTYVFVSANPVNPNQNNYTFDPDAFCKNEASRSPLSKLQNASNVVAVAFTAKRQDLNKIFASAKPIFDLDDNFLAANSSDLFQHISPVSMRGPLNTTLDSSVQFWTGTASGDISGRNAGVTCGDFTGGNAGSKFSYGKLFLGLYAGLSNCGVSQHLLCAANVPTLQGPSSAPDAIHVFFSEPATIGQNVSALVSPDSFCTSNANASNASIFVGRTIIALVKLTNRTSFNMSSKVVDLQNNSLATNLTTLLSSAPITRVSLTTAKGFHIDIDQKFWIGGTNSCQNFTTTGGTSPVATLLNGTLAGEDVKHCVGSEYVFSALLPQCGYRNDQTGKWETAGCDLAFVNTTWLQCKCTHLTDFAVLSPKSNRVVPGDLLDLTPENVATHTTGLIAVLVILAIFAVVFALAWRRDRNEAAEYDKLRLQKQEKWASFVADNKKTTLVKQIKIAFQKRHTWFSLVFRKSGTSFKSVDRTFVAMMSVFSSMSMSALFHAQDNDDIARAVAWVLTILMALFVRTGEIGFFEEWEYATARRGVPVSKWAAYRFPDSWRFVWRGATVLAVIGMIIDVLTMSMRFDRQPFYYCQGEPAKAWVVTWLSAYAITVFGYEPLRLLLFATLSYFLDDRRAALRNSVELSKTN